MEVSRRPCFVAVDNLSIITALFRGRALRGLRPVHVGTRGPLIVRARKAIVYDLSLFRSSTLKKEEIVFTGFITALQGACFRVRLAARRRYLVAVIRRKVAPAVSSEETRET